MASERDSDFKPEGDNYQGGNDYQSSTGKEGIQSDDAPVEDPIDPATADSDEQLVRDDSDAIDESNIVSGRTRGAAKPSGTYQEPDEDDIEAEA